MKPSKPIVFISASILNCVPLLTYAQSHCPIMQTMRSTQCPPFNTTDIDQFTGQDSVLIGGHPRQDVKGQLVPPGTLAVPAKVSIFGTPDGTYNEGCSLCLFMGRTQWNTQRAAVSGIDYRAGAAAVTGYNDAVGLYSWSGNIPPTLALQVDHYDAHHVYLKNPLTPEQMSLLHPNQYLATNSLYRPTSATYAPIRQKPADHSTWQEGYYKGIIAGWDEVRGQFITVAAWAAPASKETTAGQIPTPTYSGGPTTLDTLFTQYKTPMVFVGAVTGVSAKNEFITLDQRKISLVRSAQVDEQDLLYHALYPHSIAHDNIVISDAGLKGSPYSGLDAFTTNSRVFRINSQKPVIFDIGMEGKAALFKAASFVVNGQYGVNTPNAVPLATMAGWAAYTDGTNKMNIVSYLKKENPTLGAAGTSVHFGLELDGNLNTPESGRPWGQLVWNAEANNIAGIALCGGSNTLTCGLSVGYNNMVVANAITLRANQGITFTPLNPSFGSPYLYATTATTLALKTSSGQEASLTSSLFKATSGIQNAAYTLSTLPRSGFADGAQIWCADCTLKGIKGVPAYWHASAKKWTDSQNTPLKP